MKKVLIGMTCALSVGFSSSVALAADTKTKGVETTVNTQPSVKDGADKTQSQNQTGQIMSYLTGGMYISTGYTDISAGYASCPYCNYGLIAKGVFEVGLGIMSMQQGNAHGSAANSAGFTGMQTNGLGDPYGTGGVDPLDPRNPNSPLLKDPAVASAYGNLAKLEKQGILDLKNGTIKAGDKTYKLSDFSSTGAMAAAGVPKGAIDGLMSWAGGVEKRAAEKMEKMKLGSMTAVNGFDEGGGGGQIGGTAPEDSSSMSAGGGVASGAGGLGASGLNRDPSSFSGMQKNYNGEPIGVAADSIFLMMTRRYKVKESQESFFTDADLALKSNK